MITLQNTKVSGSNPPAQSRVTSEPGPNYRSPPRNDVVISHPITPAPFMISVSNIPAEVVGAKFEAVIRETLGTTRVLHVKFRPPMNGLNKSTGLIHFADSAHVEWALGKLKDISVHGTRWSLILSQGGGPDQSPLVWFAVKDTRGSPAGTQMLPSWKSNIQRIVEETARLSGDVLSMKQYLGDLQGEKPPTFDAAQFTHSLPILKSSDPTKNISDSHRIPPPDADAIYWLHFSTPAQAAAFKTSIGKRMMDFLPKGWTVAQNFALASIDKHPYKHGYFQKATGTVRYMCSILDDIHPHPEKSNDLHRPTTTSSTEARQSPANNEADQSNLPSTLSPRLSPPASITRAEDSTSNLVQKLSADSPPHTVMKAILSFKAAPIHVILHMPMTQPSADPLTVPIANTVQMPLTLAITRRVALLDDFLSTFIKENTCFYALPDVGDGDTADMSTKLDVFTTCTEYFKTKGMVGVTDVADGYVAWWIPSSMIAPSSLKDLVQKWIHLDTSVFFLVILIKP